MRFRGLGRLSGLCSACMLIGGVGGRKMLDGRLMMAREMRGARRVWGVRGGEMGF